MAYKCPRCSEPVQRGHSSTAQVAGLVGAMFYAAFGAFSCKKCGKISKAEFPPEDRRKMLVGTLALVIGAILLLLFVFWLLSAR